MLSWVRECPQCQETYYTKEKTHCVKCGAELEYKFDKGWICDECHSEIEDDWDYCGYCGNNVQDRY